MIYPHEDDFITNRDGLVFGILVPELFDDGLVFYIKLCEPLYKDQMGPFTGENITPKQHVMMSTLKKDVDGIEIYEGDIVSCYKWFDGSQSKPKDRTEIEVEVLLNSSIDDKYHSGFSGMDLFRNIKVIGNIYESR